MDSTTKIQIPKLIGSINYSLQAIYTRAYLLKIGYFIATDDNFNIDENNNSIDIDQKALYTIQLLVEDGPLLQIQHSNSTQEAQNTL